MLLLCAHLHLRVFCGDMANVWMEDEEGDKLKNLGRRGGGEMQWCLNVTGTLILPCSISWICPHDTTNLIKLIDNGN